MAQPKKKKKKARKERKDEGTREKQSRQRRVLAGTDGVREYQLVTVAESALEVQGSALRAQHSLHQNANIRAEHIRLV